MNPLHWKQEHQLAGAIAFVLGALAGIAYSFYCWQMSSFNTDGMTGAWTIIGFLIHRPRVYWAWLLIGAVTGALIFYMTRLLKAETDAR